MREREGGSTEAPDRGEVVGDLAEEQLHCPGQQGKRFTQRRQREEIRLSNHLQESRKPAGHEIMCICECILQQMCVFCVSLSNVFVTCISRCNGYVSCMKQHVWMCSSYQLLVCLCV